MIMNTNILASVFENYQINNVIMIEDGDKLNFIISNMTSSFNLDRWNYLENILNDITGKKINLITYNQALNYFDSSYISKGLVIK